MTGTKWSDLKLADEKALRRKKRELARLERQKKLAAQKKKEKIKLFSFIGVIIISIILFVVWLYSSWKSQKEKEFLKYQVVKVNKLQGMATLINFKDKEIKAHEGLKGLFKEGITQKKSKLILSLHGAYYFELWENADLAWKILGITSLGKTKMFVQPKSGTLFIRCADLSTFQLQTLSGIKIHNVKNCKFHLRVDFSLKGISFVVEYGALELQLKTGKKMDLKPMHKYLILKSGKVTFQPIYSFKY
jgi:hypothetical protein